MKDLLFDYKTSFDDFAQHFRETKVGSTLCPGQKAYVVDNKKWYILTNSYIWCEYKTSAGIDNSNFLTSNDVSAICI